MQFNERVFCKRYKKNKSRTNENNTVNQMNLCNRSIMQQIAIISVIVNKNKLHELRLQTIVILILLTH